MKATLEPRLRARPGQRYVLRQPPAECTASPTTSGTFGLRRLSHQSSIRPDRVTLGLERPDSWFRSTAVMPELWNGIEAERIWVEGVRRGCSAGTASGHASPGTGSAAG
jgi:hypothetical protein